ncbi:type III secretion system protein [Providencia alcalifaciens]|uniref:InvB/SpaK family type III secretion system chaperone n=1 Tax=Providencia alcalifaciens TaxID=126385 RepID=UPI001CE18C9F|nr:type III secretion system protein [Providencia alcalifaciens]UBX50518.1 type III secretion system protein [Providencia alcalifaciens]
MKYRFVEKLNEFLNSMGRSDLVNPQLDCHSNIQLEMNDAPAINIDLSSDDLIIWCNLMECNYSRLDASSASLLKGILEYVPRNFHAGQPALNIMENNLVLSAVLKSASLDNMQLFADSFEEFFERATELRLQLS